MNHSAPALLFLSLTVLAGAAVRPLQAQEQPAQSATAPVDFNRDIRPILSNNCYACHGPDENKRKAGLRLDRKEEALRKHESKRSAIVSGQADKSELIARITSQDDDERMPPRRTGKRLSP